MNRIFRGYLFVILSAILFGCLPLAANIAYDNGLNSLSLVFYRNLFALPILYLPIRLRGEPLRVSRQEFTNILPLSILGFCITPALLLFRQPFTFMAIIGVMGLVGMMVKNAIVLVDEINRLQKEERMPAYRAVIEATVSRVRPVLMASLTTIVGMIPLLGDPMYGSMAITIMGGLTVGTVITLLLLPFFYTVLFSKTVKLSTK